MLPQGKCCIKYIFNLILLAHIDIHRKVCYKLFYDLRYYIF